MAESYDVIVVGGGNAALCAALAAREAGSRVLVLERSPEHVRGGNTRHTRNIRCSHAAADQFFSGPYSEEEHLQDLIGVTGGPANLDLAKLAIRESSTLPAWMSAHGVHWQQPLAGTLHLGRTNRWFLGGGKALLNTYYQTAARMGIEVRYNALVEDLAIENNRFEGVRLKNENGGELVRARAVVVAAGGYEANIEWLKRHWGDAADNFIIRGSPYNDGTLLAALLKHGAKAIGDPKGFSCHWRRCARSEIRRRHRDAARRDSFRNRREPRRTAFLRRRRGHLAEALRDLGDADRGAARANRVLHCGRKDH